MRNGEGDGEAGPGFARGWEVNYGQQCRAVEGASPYGGDGVRAGDGSKYEIGLLSHHPLGEGFAKIAPSGLRRGQSVFQFSNRSLRLSK